MHIYPIKILNSSILPTATKTGRIIRKAAIGTALCASALLPASCYYECSPPKIEDTYTTPKNIKEVSETILPDTVNQPILQNIFDVHERIDNIFSSLEITEQGKNIQDIKTLEFEDAEGNKYKYTDIQKTVDGYKFLGTVYHNGIEENTFMKFSDGYNFIKRPLVCLETNFNKKHNLSMIYQNRWRLGEDGNPERRLFQNRINKNVDWIDPKEYYPYDEYNVFSIRRKEDCIKSTVLNEGKQFTSNDEIKNINVVYK